MAPDFGGDDLLAFLLLAAFLIFLLPPMVSTITGIACGMALPNGSAGWGGFVGLGLGVSGIAINIAGLFLLVFFLLPYTSFSGAELAREIFCPDDRYLHNLDRDSICRRALRWAPEVFWIGISLVTPAAAAVGTWWLCRRRSIGQR